MGCRALGICAERRFRGFHQLGQMVRGVRPGRVQQPGRSSSRAGIADFLINNPRFLIIDELDKMKAEDYSVLLSLMQSGVVARLKKGLRDINRMTTWVFRRQPE